MPNRGEPRRAGYGIAAPSLPQQRRSLSVHETWGTPFNSRAGRDLTNVRFQQAYRFQNEAYIIQQLPMYM
jgi:hypothetical protein